MISSGFRLRSPTSGQLLTSNHRLAGVTLTPSKRPKTTKKANAATPLPIAFRPNH